MHPAVATAQERNHEADAQAWQRWKDRHDGRPPSRCATDPEERNIAKAYSYVPRRLFAFHPDAPPIPRQSASSTSQQMEQTLRAVQEHMRAHQGALPSQRGGAGALRKRFDRIRALAKDQADTLTIPVRQLLAECEASAPGAKWTKAERRARKWELGRMQAALREACAAWSAEVGTHVLQLPQLQLAAGPANTFGGASPFPGFVNLGSTCYLNANLKCLFHCGKARAAIAALGPAADQSLAGALRGALAALLRRYIEGEVSTDARAKYDVLVPHNVFSALRLCQPSFTLGHQHDAHEALSLILDKTGLDETCFKCGQAPLSEFVKHDEHE